MCPPYARIKNSASKTRKPASTRIQVGTFCLSIAACGQNARPGLASAPGRLFTTKLFLCKVNGRLARPPAEAFDSRAEKRNKFCGTPPLADGRSPAPENGRLPVGMYKW
jgi:hypothetical protein